jgi:hypothetical protein
MQPIISINQLKLANLKCLRSQIMDRSSIIFSQLEIIGQEIIELEKVCILERDQALRSDLGLPE